MPTNDFETGGVSRHPLPAKRHQNLSSMGTIGSGPERPLHPTLVREISAPANQVVTAGGCGKLPRALTGGPRMPFGKVQITSSHHLQHLLLQVGRQPATRSTTRHGKSTGRSTNYRPPINAVKTTHCHAHPGICSEPPTKALYSTATRGGTHGTYEHGRGTTVTRLNRRPKNRLDATRSMRQVEGSGTTINGVTEPTPAP